MEKEKDCIGKTTRGEMRSLHAQEGRKDPGAELKRAAKDLGRWRGGYRRFRRAVYTVRKRGQQGPALTNHKYGKCPLCYSPRRGTALYRIKKESPPRGSETRVGRKLPQFGSLIGKRYYGDQIQQ